MAKCCTSKSLMKKYGFHHSVISSLKAKGLIEIENGIINKSEEEILQLICEHTNVITPERLPMPDGFVQIEDAALMKGVGVTTIKRWASRNRLKVYKIFSKTNEFVKIEDLEKMIVLRRRKNANKTEKE